MAMTVEELQVLITAETSQLRRDLARVRQQLEMTDQASGKATEHMGHQMKEVSKHVGHARSSFIGMYKDMLKMTLVMGAVTATFAAFAAGVSAVKDAMNFEASVQQVNRLMGESVGVFQQWVTTQAASWGMGISQATEFGATYANLISNFSRTQEETTQRTIQLLQTSAIVASKTGRSMTDVMERIRSGMLGETDAIEDLGININVAMLESTEAFRTFAGDSSWQKLNFQTQQTILYYAILEQAARKYGNTLQANTMTRQAMFIAQLQNARLYLGQAFLPIYNAVLPALTAMARALATAMKWLAAFTTALFGGGGAAATQSQAAAIGDLGGAYQSTGDKAAAAGDSIKDAGNKAKDAAKKAKQAVAGFDKLNLIGGTSADAADAADAAGDAGSAGWSPIGAGGGIPISATDFSGVTGGMDAVTTKAREMAAKVREALGSLGEINLAPLRDSLAGLWDALKPFAQNVGAGLLWFLKEVLIPLGKWTIERALPAFLDVLAGAIRVLNSVINAFKPVATWLWDSFLKPLATWTGGVIVASLGSLAGALNQLSSWIDSHQQAFVEAALFIGAFFAAFRVAELVAELAPVIAALAELASSGTLVAIAMEAVTGALAAVFSPITLVAGLIAVLIASFVDLYKESESFRTEVMELGKTWLGALQPVADFVRTVLTDSWDKILKPVINFFVQTLIPQVMSIFNQLWQQVLVPLANGIGTMLTPVLQILSDVLTMLWKYIVLPLAEAIGSVLAHAWDALYDILTITVIPVIGNVIDVVTKLWKNVLNPIIDVLWKNLKPAFETVFSGIKTVIEGLKTTLNGIIDFISGMFTRNWGKAWEGVKSVFKGVFDALYGIVQVPLNLIIDAINKVIKGLNSMDIDLPDWMGGESFGLSIPTIPHLATGGLAYGPTLAMVGDNRGAASDPEVISPLSKLQGMLDTGGSNQDVVRLLSQMLTVLKSGQGDLILQVGATEIGRVAAAGINDIQRRTGVSPLRV